MKGALGVQSVVGVGVTAGTAPVVLSLLVVWAALLSSYFVLLYFSNKGQKIIKLSSFDGTKP